MDEVHRIARVARDYRDKPEQPERMKTVTVETFGEDYAEPEKLPETK